MADPTVSLTFGQLLATAMAPAEERIVFGDD